MVTAACGTYLGLREYPWLAGTIHISEAIDALFASNQNEQYLMPSKAAVDQFVEVGLQLEWLPKSQWLVRRNTTPLE